MPEFKLIESSIESSEDDIKLLTVDSPYRNYNPTNTTITISDSDSDASIILLRPSETSNNSYSNSNSNSTFNSIFNSNTNDNVVKLYQEAQDKALAWKLALQRSSSSSNSHYFQPLKRTKISPQKSEVFPIISSPLKFTPPSSSKTHSNTNYQFPSHASHNNVSDIEEASAPLTELEQTKTLQTLLSNAVLAQDITPKELRISTPKFLRIQLSEHQKLGLEWMLKMEKGSNKGGLLADDMGLGKTIQAISLILENPSKDPNGKATLVIAPTSLIFQWENELKDRVKNEKLRVFVHYGTNKATSSSQLNCYDVVISTYGTVGSEWPAQNKNKNKKGKQKMLLNPDSEDETYIRRYAGPIFKNYWHRIILDEAHTIKNKSTKSAKSVCKLDSNYRWCLTGTPIQNNIGEIFSLLQFLRIRPYNEWTMWRHKIEDPFSRGRQKYALRRLQTLMKAICLRRRKTDLLDGSPIIVIPERIVNVDINEFSQAEREFYDALEKKVQLQFNTYMRAGTVMKNYTNILLLLLRLRQAACHPSLVINGFDKVTEEERAQSEKENLQSTKNLLEEVKPDVLNRLLSIDDLKAQECPICFDVMDAGMIIQICGHCFCRECLERVNEICPQCRKSFLKTSLIPISMFLLKYKPSVKPEFIFPIEIKDDAIVKESCGDEWLSSTKIDRLMEILHDTKNNHPDDKTIVFSQFVGMLNLIEVPLYEDKISFTRLDGSMNAKEREESLRTFRSNKNVNVLLISLKCGSLGLNLTCANRVCLMDVWWNPAIENQAIDRVHRFGQLKTVIVYRLIINTSVEDRIMELQKKSKK